jgi:hypothetical protein
MVERVSRVALAIAFLAVEGCDDLSPPERELAHTDAEVFEAVARSQWLVGVEDSSRLLPFLRIDSRPVDNTSLLPPQIPASAGIAPEDDSIPLSPATISRITDERRAILERLGVEEGGPFSFPGCEGIRTGEPARQTGAASSGSRCPKQWRRYVTIGLPHRGVGMIPERVRRTDPRPFDSGEVWSVLVTETSIGPGGQDWKQYAWVLSHEPGRAGLNVAAQFLLSWAE